MTVVERIPVRDLIRDLAPAILVGLGMAATTIGAAFEHSSYTGMDCHDAKHFPVSGATLYSIALALGTAALMVFMSSVRLRKERGRAHTAICIFAMVVAVVATIALGCLAGPRDQHGQDPIAGLMWIAWLLASLVIASTLKGGLSLWRTHRAHESPGAVATTTLIGVMVSLGVVWAFSYHYWVDPHAVQKICWYG